MVMVDFWACMEDQVWDGTGRNEEKQKNLIVFVNPNCYQNSRQRLHCMEARCEYYFEGNRTLSTKMRTQFYLFISILLATFILDSDGNKTKCTLGARDSKKCKKYFNNRLVLASE